MLTRRWQMGLASVVLAVAAHGVVHAAGQPAEFDKGLELLRRGQYAQAVQVLSTELKASDRPIEQRARTFYFRAKAYAALKEDALARADLNIAVWLKKLPPAEATDAARLKTQLDSASPVPAPGLGVTPVASQPIAPVKTAPPATETAAQLRAPSRVATTAAPPAPRPAPDAGQQRAAPAWSQASVAHEPVETKPVAYIRPSPAFEAAAASQQPQRPAVQTSTIVTGALPPPKKEASTPVAPPAPSTLWQTNVASQPSTPPPQMAAAMLPSPPRPVAPLRPAPTAYSTTPAPSASPVAVPSATAAAPRTEPPQSAALAPADQPKEPMDPAPAASQDGSSLPLVGWMFEKQSSPYDSQISRADDFQRRYIEKIRAYNQGARQRDSGAVGSQQ
ncbi:MAG: hypothetical protein JNL45_04265 [Hyphomicrobium sp.]|nr:hypothetical protein [Hyphomicrobium sp.]